jgi:hypothetical protein
MKIVRMVYSLTGILSGESCNVSGLKSGQKAIARAGVFLAVVTATVAAAPLFALSVVGAAGWQYEPVSPFRLSNKVSVQDSDANRFYVSS